MIHRDFLLLIGHLVTSNHVDARILGLAVELLIVLNYLVSHHKK